MHPSAVLLGYGNVVAEIGVECWHFVIALC
jgi:hypothetical protein